MKKILFFFSFIVGILPGKSFSQTPQVSDTITSRWELDSLRRPEYEKFEETFQEWFRTRYCVKMKIKISCAGCSRFYVPLTFRVDEKGKIVIIETGKTNFCGKPLSEKQKTEFLKGFDKIIFSELFYGRIFFLNFNRTLKC